MKILLVNPEINFRSFPLGIAYISSSLKQSGFNVYCLDLSYYLPQDYEGLIENAIIEHDVDIIGTGGYHHSFTRIEMILTVARRVKPSIIKILGGTLFSTLPTLVFERLNIDFGVTGEGDETVVDLVRTLQAGEDVSKVSGIYYRDMSGAVVASGTRQLITDINAIPFPDYEGFELDRYLELTGQMGTNVVTDIAPMLDNPRYSSMLASRSCPFGCTFCYHVMGRSYRRRSFASLFAEVDHLVARYRVNMINFIDDLFVIKRDEALEFCRRIKPYNIMWFVQLRVNNIDAELLDIMREAGCRYISYGIESINPSVLCSMNKKILPQQIDNALNMTYRGRIAFQGNLIFGDPAETIDTVNESLTWWEKNRKYQIWTWLIQTYPGAPIFRRAKELGVVADDLEYALTGGSGIPPFTINITTMDDATFNELKMVVLNLYALPRLPAELVSISARREHARNVDGVTYESLPMVDITIRCPECQNESAYQRISFFGQRRLICRQCGARIDTPLCRFQSLLAPSEHRRLLHEAQDMYQRGDLKEALEIFSQCPEVLKYPDGQALAGTVMLGLGLLDNAYKYLAVASGMDPFTAYIENNYGITLFAAGRVGLALMRFRQAKILQPGYSDACINESLVLAHLGFNEAVIPFLVPPQQIAPLDIRRFRITTPKIKERDIWGCGLTANFEMPAVWG